MSSNAQTFNWTDLPGFVREYSDSFSSLLQLAQRVVRNDMSRHLIPWSLQMSAWPWAFFPFRSPCLVSFWTHLRPMPDGGRHASPPDLMTDPASYLLDEPVVPLDVLTGVLMPTGMVILTIVLPISNRFTSLSRSREEWVYAWALLCVMVSNNAAGTIRPALPVDADLFSEEMILYTTTCLRGLRAQLCTGPLGDALYRQLDSLGPADVVRFRQSEVASPDNSSFYKAVFLASRMVLHREGPITAVEALQDLRAEAVLLAVRVQRYYGLAQHPQIARADWPRPPFIRLCKSSSGQWTALGRVGSWTRRLPRRGLLRQMIRDGSDCQMVWMRQACKQLVASTSLIPDKQVYRKRANGRAALRDG